MAVEAAYVVLVGSVVPAATVAALVSPADFVGTALVSAAAAGDGGLLLAAAAVLSVAVAF